MTDPVRRALTAAAHEASRSGYAVPEGAVRARARRRRAARVGATGLLSLTVIAAGGVALATLEPPRATPPAVTTTAPDAGHATCGTTAGHDGAALLRAEREPGVELQVQDDPTELVVPIGDGPDISVALHYRGRGEIAVTNVDGPAVLAVDDSGTVVGYSLLRRPSNVVLYGPEAIATYAGYGPIVACPGVPAVDDLLPYGEYGAVIAQSLTAQPAVAFDAVIGDIELVVAPAPTAPVLRSGECGTSLDRLPEGSGHHASFDPLVPVLAVAGEPVDPAVSMTNRGPRDLEDVIQGGPVLLVGDTENRIVARSEPTDPLPGPQLAPGESLSFGRFAPLVHCETGEPLGAGSYRYAVAQQSRDPESSRPIGISTRFGDLVVTEDRTARRDYVELPVLPACGEPVEGFAFDVGTPADRVTFTGFASWDHEDTTLQEDLVEGRPTVEYEFTYDGPAREHTFLTRGSVLVRDGVVVAAEEAGGWDGAQPATWQPGSAHRATLGSGFDCTADPEDYVELEAGGRYTVIGFTAYDYVDEWGLTNNTVITLGPVEVDFGQR